MKQATWGKRTSEKPRGLRYRLAWRIVASVLALAMVCWLFWLLLQPFWHPRTHLVLLTGAAEARDDQLLAAPPSEYVVEDFRAFMALDPVLDRGLFHSGPLILGNLHSREQMQQLSEPLANVASGSTDVLIVYVTAQGIADAVPQSAEENAASESSEGTAYLMCTSVDPQSPRAGRYRVRNLLDQLSASPAGVKLLIMDAGRIDYDPARGMVVNQFPRLLRKEVERTADPRLWVLCSHSTGERSQLSPALRRSVFGYFVAEGLKGAADLDGDLVVQLAELQRYVAVNVAAWVQESTGGNRTQSPFLAWGGGAAATRANPGLLAVLPKKEPEEDSVEPLSPSDKEASHMAAIREAQTTSTTDNRVAERGKLEMDSFIDQQIARSTPDGRVGQYARDAARRALAKQGGVPGELPDTKPDNVDKKPDEVDKAKGAEGGDKTGAAEENSKTPEEVATKGELTAAASATAENAKGVAEKEAPAESTSVASTTNADSASASAMPASVIDVKFAALSTPELLTEAWRLRDELADPTRRGPRPLDFAPHLWRNIERQLIALECRNRTGLARDAAAVQTSLSEIVTTLDKLARNERPEGFSAATIGWRIAQAMPGRTVPIDELHTLAIAELAGRSGASQLPVALQQDIDQLDFLIARGTRLDFAVWIEKLPADRQRYSELRLARQLAALPGVDWKLMQLALQTRRVGEQAASSGVDATVWVREQVESADRLRLAGERELLDNIRRDPEATSATLRRALTIYQTAHSDMSAVLQARLLRNDLLHSAPYYLQWHAQAGENIDGSAPRYAALSELLDDLFRLAELLEQPDPVNLAALRRLVPRLERARNQIEQSLQPDAIDLLIGPPPQPGDAWRIELLLSTPLLKAAQRQKLVDSLASMDAQIAAGISLPDVTRAELPGIDATSADGRIWTPKAELELKLTRLAEAKLGEPATELSPLAQRWNDLVKARDHQVQQLATVGADPPLWQMLAQFGAALQDFYHALPARLDLDAARARPLSERPTNLPELRAAQRWLQLVDPRDVRRVDQFAVGTKVERADIYDFIAWQRERFLAARPDAPPADALFLTAAAARYRAIAEAIFAQPPLGRDAAPPLEWQGPSAVSLSVDSEFDLQLTLADRGSSSDNAWIVLDYDPELLSVRPPSSVVAYNAAWLQERLRNRASTAPVAGSTAAPIAAGPNAAYPLWPDAATVRPSLVLRPGLVQTLSFKLRRKQASPFPTRLIVKAISSTAYVRKEIEVDLPAPETIGIDLAGTPGTWSTDELGLALHPFPNRTTPYSMRLLNSTKLDKQVDVQLYPLAANVASLLPQAALQNADADRLLEELSLGEPIGKVTALALPGGQPVEIPFPPPPKPLPPPKPGAAVPPPPVVEAVPASRRDVPLPYGLLLVVSDPAEKQKTLKRIEITPQRPSRFLRPKVSYSPARQRIEIQVTPLERSLLPADGVQVHCEIADPLPADAEVRLDGELKAPAYEANLYAEVQSALGRVVPVRLHVDGYPRAFVYRVPCNAQMVDIPEEADLLAVRIASLPRGLVYKAPAGVIPVQLQIDAPAASRSRTFGVDVGIDRDRDRELRGEPTVHLTSERQTRAKLDHVGPRGEFVVQTEVSDFTIDLTEITLTDSRANVLARAQLGKRVAWSEPVEIVIDGRPPRLSAVELRPDRVTVIGGDLEVSVIANDDELSGIAKVEAMFDMARSGQFAADAAPIPATLEASGRWVAKLPTAALSRGAYTVLVRATDRMGNVSDISKVRVQAVTPAEVASAKEAAKLGRVAGIVVFGQEPQAGIKVTLTLDPAAPPPPPAAGPPPVFAPTTTDDAGAFAFEHVPPGKYKATAEGLIHNKRRKIEVPVAVEPPLATEPLRLKLP
jgi:hypothetical protein